jgi:hypothetical protein
VKITITGLLALKPFDEAAESARAGSTYANSVILTVGVVSSAALAFAAVAMALTGHRQAMLVIGVAIGVSAITTGFEWNAGLRARALNQLFGTVVFAAGFFVLS